MKKLMKQFNEITKGGENMKKVIVILVALMLMIPSMANANTLTNSTFETGSQTPWVTIGFHTRSVLAAAAHSGAFGLRMTMESPVQGDGWGGVYQNRPASAGQTHFLKGWLNTSLLNSEANATLQIAYFDVANPGVSAVPLSTFDTTPITGTGWTQQSLTSVAAPAGTVAVRYTLAQWGSTDSFFPGTGSTYFDDIDGDVVPEPSSLLLLGTGIIGMLSASRKRKA